MILFFISHNPNYKGVFYKSVDSILYLDMMNQSDIVKCDK